MIRSIKIDNFKSLVDFELNDLNGFTCLIGLNGSGKTTLLQAFDFLGQLMRGQVSEWLKVRRWQKADLRSKLQNKHTINFEVVLELAQKEVLRWQGVFNISLLQCTRETITRIDGGRNEVLFSLKEKRYTAFSSPEMAIPFIYEGSMLSQVAIFPGVEPINSPIQQMKHEMVQLKSLELLAPNLMRKRSRSAADIGVGGEELSGFVSSLSVQTKNEIAAVLQSFYTHFQSFDVSALRSGWQNLFLTEDYTGDGYATIKSDVWHINDGLLRLLALVSQTKTSNTILLFDEIENGINPELIEKLVDYLVGCGKQIIVTTHSPMILNYLEDDVARKSVVLIFKGPSGKTSSMKYFDNPETSRKLSLIGPGEVFIDTPIVDVVEHHMAAGAQ